VALRRSVARFPASFQVLVHDCPWVTGVKARLDAHPALLQLDGQKTVASQPELRAVLQKALLAAAHQAQSSDGLMRVMADELVLLREGVLQAALRGQPILQLVELPRAKRAAP
jgi:hypothetical protein